MQLGGGQQAAVARRGGGCTRAQPAGERGASQWRGACEGAWARQADVRMGRGEDGLVCNRHFLKPCNGGITPPLLHMRTHDIPHPAPAGVASSEGARLGLCPSPYCRKLCRIMKCRSPGGGVRQGGVLVGEGSLLPGGNKKEETCGGSCSIRKQPTHLQLLSG